ncbi:MAG: hypothetical protein ABIH37_02705 [archaeon]
MVVLDQVMQMKKQGVPTGRIIQNLKEQGISAKEINEALSQSEIKSELTRESQNSMPPQQNYQNQQPQNTNLNQQNFQDPNTRMASTNTFGSAPQDRMSTFQDAQQPTNTTGMQPSIGTNSSQMQGDQYPGAYSPSTVPEEYSEYPQEQYYDEYQQYPDQQYQEQQYPEYESPQATDIETINDISEQIVEEKIKQLKKEITLFARFRRDSQEKINNFEKRLEKIENTIEELELTIIKKISGYGEDIKNLSGEMEATQKSFSKMLNPMTDDIREREKTSRKKGKEKSKSSKRSDGFESYLR